MADTFLLVGGETRNRYLDTIYKYEENAGWRLLPQRLNHVRGAVTAIVLDQ